MDHIFSDPFQDKNHDIHIFIKNDMNFIDPVMMESVVEFFRMMKNRKTSNEEKLVLCLMGKERLQTCW